MIKVYLVFAVGIILLSGCGRQGDVAASSLNEDPASTTINETAQIAITEQIDSTSTLTGPELNQTQNAIEQAFLPVYPAPTINPDFMYPPPMREATETLPTAVVIERRGILAECENTFMPLLRQKNCWAGRVDNQDMGVGAGSSRTDDSIGKLCIASRSSAYEQDSTTCLEVAQHGALRIMKEEGLALVLLAEDGTQFTLDLLTQTITELP